ncbi:MAG: hypothetical protein LBM41_02300 [Ruminococcus sp.]|nr:hypothetical protein [Ruminococcus sp.]
MKRFTKITAAVTAAVLALSMTACGADTTTFGTINGVTIPVGIYINFQYMAYNEAVSLVAQEEAAAAVSSAAPIVPDGSADVASVTLPFIQKTVEGKNVRDWITDTAIEDVREFAIIDQKFSELGLGYGDGERESVINYIDQNWEYFSAELDELGISRESYEQVLLNSMKRQEVFLHYYGKGGEREVPDDVIKEYLLENNARIDYIPMELKDGEGNLLKSEGKAERMAMAEDYIARSQNGEDFASLLAEYNDYYDTLIAEATPADPAAENAETAETPDTDELDPNAEAQVITNDTTITKDSAFPAASVVTRAFEEQSAYPGQERYFIVEDPAGEYYYVVKLFDLLADTADFENNRETVISTIYSEEFDELVRSWLPAQEVVLNDKSIARYKVEKYEEMYG